MKSHLVLVFAMMGSASASECICDGYDVADQASERTPPACVLGVTASPKFYPPGVTDFGIWLYHKIRSAHRWTVGCIEKGKFIFARLAM